MHRRLLIPMVCLVLVAAAGTPMAVAAKADGTPQAGDSPVHLFDVDSDGHVAGKLMVNTAARTFVLNAKGLEPRETLYLRYLAGATPRTLAIVVPDKAGHVHLAGRWPASLDVGSAGSFTIGPAAGSLVAVLDWQWTCSAPDAAGVQDCDAIFRADRSTGPIVTYKLDFKVTYPSGLSGGGTPYWGSDPLLGSRTVPVDYGPGYTTKFILTVSDGAGNAAVDTVDLTYHP
jgi:hypothetical protein